MNITHHALKRYAERFKEVSRQDLDSNIIVNKELYSNELNKMFEYGKLLYTGRFNDENGDVNYYIVDNIILVVDLANTKIITIYRIEFGFGREVDKNILVGLLSQLDEAETNYIEAMDIVKEKKEDLEYNVLTLQEEIKSTEELLNTLKVSLFELNSMKKSITLDEDRCRIARDKIAKKLVYSNIYKNAVNEY